MTGRAPEIIASHHSCQLRICCSSPHLGHQGQREASPYFKDKTEDALPGGSFKQSFIVGPLCCVAAWPGRHAAREIAPTCGMLGSFVLQNVFRPTKDAFGFRLGCSRIKYLVIYFFLEAQLLWAKICLCLPYTPTLRKLESQSFFINISYGSVCL